MLGAKHRFVQSVDKCAISGLCKHDEWERLLLTTWPALGTVESN